MSREAVRQPACASGLQLRRRPAKIEKLFYGQAQPLNQVLPAGMPGYVAGATGFYGYDPAKAKQLLAQAGFPNGFSVTLYSHNVDPMPKLAQTSRTTSSRSASRPRSSCSPSRRYWASDQKARGRADRPDRLVHGLPRSVRLDRAALQQGRRPPTAAATRAGGGIRRWRRNSPPAQVMADPTARHALFEQMQTYIMSQAPIMPLYQPLDSTLRTKRVGGFLLSPGLDLRLRALLDQQVACAVHSLGRRPSMRPRPLNSEETRWRDEWRPDARAMKRSSS